MMRFASVRVFDELVQTGNGKLGYVGVYGSGLIVPVIPTTLDQLIFNVTFRSDISDPFSKMAIRIERPGLPPIEEDHTKQIPDPSAPKAPDSKFWVANVFVRVKPFEIVEAGTVRVFVTDDLTEHYAGGLRLQIGALASQWQPRVLSDVNFILAHLERFKNSPSQQTDKLRAQLLNALDVAARFVGMKPKLRNDGDLRIQLNSKTVHVFFPAPLPNAKDIKFVELPEGVKAQVLSLDELGFVAELSPTVPSDMRFKYSIS